MTGQRTMKKRLWFMLLSLLILVQLLGPEGRLNLITAGYINWLWSQSKTCAMDMPQANGASKTIREPEGAPILSGDLPEGWTKKQKSVTVATPEGEKRMHITYYTNTIGLRFVRIPAGEFHMGSQLSVEQVVQNSPCVREKWYEDEHPRHRVRISKPFFIGATEVSREHYELFVQETGWRTRAEVEGEAYGYVDQDWGHHDGISRKKPGYPQSDNHPVVCLSWEDAWAFCIWLSKKEGVNYELPTEAQWAYAARAGSDTVYFWGNNAHEVRGKENVANNLENSCGMEERETKWMPDPYRYTSPCGTFMPNAFGIWDMLGNASEWCRDRYDADYYSESPVVDPKGVQNGHCHVSRGGSWCSQPIDFRTATRIGIKVRSDSSNDIGFRVVVTRFSLE